MTATAPKRGHRRLPHVMRHAPAESRADAWRCDICGRATEPCDGHGYCDHRGMPGDSVCRTDCLANHGML